MSEFLDDNDVEDIWGSTPDDQLAEPELEPKVEPDVIVEKNAEIKEVVQVRDKK